MSPIRKILAKNTAREIKSSDVLIPKELLEHFGKRTKIVFRVPLAGIYPLPLKEFGRLVDSIPHVFKNDNVLKTFDVAINMKIKKPTPDIFKIPEVLTLGLDKSKIRLVDDILINGIPVPWQIIKKAGIDHNKVKVLLVPRM